MTNGQFKKWQVDNMSTTKWQVDEMASWQIGKLT
jgi:hypothetical protein